MDIFGVGTVKRNKIGILGVFTFWEKEEIRLENKQDITMVRITEPWREHAVVECRNWKYVLFECHVHIFEKDLKNLP